MKDIKVGELNHFQRPYSISCRSPCLIQSGTRHMWTTTCVPHDVRAISSTMVSNQVRVYLQLLSVRMLFYIWRCWYAGSEARCYKDYYGRLGEVGVRCWSWEAEMVANERIFHDNDLVCRKLLREMGCGRKRTSAPLKVLPSSRLMYARLAQRTPDPQKHEPRPDADLLKSVALGGIPEVCR